MKNSTINLRDLVILIADPNSYVRRVVNGMLRGFGANKVMEVEHSAALFQALSGRRSTSCCATCGCRRMAGSS